MKNISRKLFTLLLAVVMVAGFAVPAFAEAAPLLIASAPYTGESVNFVKADGETGFGMFAPQEGTTAKLEGDSVVIHYVPKNKTVYNGLHWGEITDAELTKDVAFNEDGSFDLTVSKDKCASLIPVAPVKAKDGATTSEQYYLAIPAEDKLDKAAAQTQTIAYSDEELTFIKADGSAFGMFAPQEGTGAKLEGDSVVVHYVPKNKTVYNGLHWGEITDAELTKDVAFNEDGSFDFTVAKDKCGTLIPVAPIKAKDGATTSDQYYLALPAADKLKAAEAPKGDALTITNTTAMFKADSASLVKAESGSVLVVALSGTTYKYLFKGTYEQAVANGDQRANWIEGKENADGKLEFRIPLAEGETTIPAVSVSNTYLVKYEAGENALERAFYPRQFVLDAEAKTLTVGDYAANAALEVTNNVKMFKVSSAALLTVGGPNSNNYKATLQLVMGSDSFNAAYVGRASAIAADTAVVELAEGNVFELAVKWLGTFGKPETLQSVLDKPFVVSFRSAKNGNWYERQFTVSESAGTLVIDEAPAEPVFKDVPADHVFFEAVNWAVEKKITDGVTDDTFEPGHDCTRGQIVTFLWRAAGCPASTISNPFTDVKEGEYYYEAVLWAVENGITDGVTDTTFVPTDYCTRLQAVTFMWRAANKPAAQAASSFTDVTTGADAVSWAVEKGITDGVTDTTFAPTRYCTRGQIAAFLFRASKV